MHDCKCFVSQYTICISVGRIDVMRGAGDNSTCTKYGRAILLHANHVPCGLQRKWDKEEKFYARTGYSSTQNSIILLVFKIIIIKKKMKNKNQRIIPPPT